MKPSESEDSIVKCRKCGTKNRVKKQKSPVIYQCAKCSSDLASPFKIDVASHDSENFIVECGKCSAKNRLKKQKKIVIYQCAKCAFELISPFKYVVFDCETTGLPTSKSNPHLVQLAWSVIESSGEVIKEQNYIVQPNGCSIPKSSTQVHGITDSHAKKFGVPLSHVIKSFLLDADVDGRTLVAHNINFDLRIIHAELEKLNLISKIDSRPYFCTMLNAVKICKIPKRGGGYKWPSLQELHLHLFGRHFSGGHNAMEDVRATSRCFVELKRLKLIA